LKPAVALLVFGLSPIMGYSGLRDTKKREWGYLLLVSVVAEYFWVKHLRDV
jgi:hypothetical protein